MDARRSCASSETTATSWLPRPSATNAPPVSTEPQTTRLRSATWGNPTARIRAPWIVVPNVGRAVRGRACSRPGEQVGRGQVRVGEGARPVLDPRRLAVEQRLGRTDDVARADDPVAAPRVQGGPALQPSGDGQPAALEPLDVGPRAGRHHHHVGRQPAAVLEHHPGDCCRPARPGARMRVRDARVRRQLRCSRSRCSATGSPTARTVGRSEGSTMVVSCPVATACAATSAPISPPPTTTTRRGPGLEDGAERVGVLERAKHERPADTLDEGDISSSGAGRDHQAVESEAPSRRPGRPGARRGPAVWLSRRDARRRRPVRRRARVRHGPPAA